MWFQFLAGSVISRVPQESSLSLGVCLLVCTVGMVATSVSVARKSFLCTVCTAGAERSQSSLLLVWLKRPFLSCLESSEAASNVLH